MGPFKCRVKRDTPLRPAFAKATRKRKVVLYDTLPEESEGEISSHTTTQTKEPVVMLADFKPSLMKPGSNKGLKFSAPSMTPSTPGPRVEDGFPSSDDQDLPVTSESTRSDEADVNTSSEHDDSSTSASVTFDSLPSPEIFRGEERASALEWNMEDCLPLHCNVKNSTLLDVSLAKDIYMHHAPNISNVTDATCVFGEDLTHVSKNEEHVEDPKSLPPGTPCELGSRRKISRRTLMFKKKRICFNGPKPIALPGNTTTDDMVNSCETPKRLDGGRRKVCQSEECDFVPPLRP